MNALAPSLSDSIYSRLKTRLVMGAYLPGDRLSMRKLAVEFGTSAMPVREALKRLASENALLSAAAKAYHVPPLSNTRAADLFVLRGLLESAAIEAAFPDLTAPVLAELSALRDRMDAHLKLRDFAAYMVDNHRFHFLIYQRADNPDMVFIIEQLWMLTGPSLRSGLERSDAAPRDWNDDHTRLLDAIATGDIARVAQIMRSDIEWGADFYRS